MSISRRAALQASASLATGIAAVGALADAATAANPPRFEQQPADQSPPSGAERALDRHLPALAGRPHQQQPRDVGAADQHQDGHAGDEQPHVGPQLSRLEFPERSQRDPDALARSLASLRSAAENGNNLVPHVVEAARAYATLQEICDVLRSVFGTYADPAVF